MTVTGLDMKPRLLRWKARRGRRFVAAAPDGTVICLDYRPDGDGRLPEGWYLTSGLDGHRDVSWLSDDIVDAMRIVAALMGGGDTVDGWTVDWWFPPPDRYRLRRRLIYVVNRD